MGEITIGMSVASEISMNTGKKITSWGNDVVTNGDMEDWTQEYCAEYQAVYDSYTTKPDAATAAIWNTFVETIVASGEWVKLDWMPILASHTNGAGEALTNWLNPGTFDATAVNAPAFVVNEGFTSNGVTSYIDSNWNPNTDGVNFIRDSGTIGMYSRTDQDANIIDIGCNDGTNVTVLYSRRTTGRLQINSATGLETGAVVDSLGMYIASRTASNVQKLYKNKAVIVNGTNVSSAIPSHNLYVLAQNNNGGANKYTSRQTSMAFAASGFTQTNVNNLTDAFETAMDALGKGVIP